MSKKKSTIINVLIITAAVVFFGSLAGGKIYLALQHSEQIVPRQAFIVIENGEYTAIYPANSTSWGPEGFHIDGVRFTSSNITEVQEWAINQTAGEP